jgi:uncharacterized protein YwqG
MFIKNDFLMYTLPTALEKYSKKIAATLRPFVRIHLQQAENILLWNSKVGGNPYLPKGIPFPVNAEGVQLFFLAQINFAEMPALEGFPTKGILQFFIFDDDLYGLDFDEPEAQHNFRLLFYADPETDSDTLITDFSFLRSYDDDMPFQPGSEWAVQFQLETGLMPESDFRFDGIFGEDFFARFGAEEWSLAEAYGKVSDAAGHHIGGYAEFTQEDPRLPEDPMELLFQLDTDSKNGIRWGDMGVANFFIRPDDLAQLNFSRVRYNWDCY